MTSDHQRRDPRFDANLPVQLHGAIGDTPGSLRNVSVSGAAIEFSPTLGKAHAAFEIGEGVDMRSDVADHAAHGVVVRCDANGIAIKFDQPETELLAELVSVVQKFIDRQ